MTTRIFYSDGIDTGAQRGVQAIVQADPKVSWATESHGDYYLLKEDRWYAADFSGLYTELLNRDMVKPFVGVEHEVRVGDTWVRVNQLGFHSWLDTLDWVLCGETISNDRFQEIFQAALADADFGRKHGYLPREHRS